eukprot:309285-Ditylum_brightwellii.AAC.1
MIDIYITDIDARSYISCLLELVLARQEKEKKVKYLQACLEQHYHFSVFVVSINGILSHKSSMVLKQIPKKFAEKWEYSPSYEANHVKKMTSLSIVRATYHCLQGSQVTSSSMSTHRFPCED